MKWVILKLLESVVWLLSIIKDIWLYLGIPDNLAILPKFAVDLPIGHLFLTS